MNLTTYGYSALVDSIKRLSFTEDMTSFPDCIVAIRHALSTNENVEFEADINVSALERLVGIDLGCGPDITASVTFSNPYLVQVKRHKKRRINKKWAKRYGFVTKFHDVKLNDVCYNHHWKPASDHESYFYDIN